MPRSSNHSFLQQPPFPRNDPLLFVIPSVPGFPASLLSPATTDVVLSKENHTQLTEAATLDRKSGEAEGSAVPRSFPGNVSSPICWRRWTGRRAAAHFLSSLLACLLVLYRTRSCPI